MSVVVFIHGGAYIGGQGITNGPEYLLDTNDFVYVSINYRLGILGFASTGDNVVPGNNGMKDQVAALKWIQQNIDAFGGNPNSVTITGLSAGASSVHYHLLSPMSKGNIYYLFPFLMPILQQINNMIQYTIILILTNITYAFKNI